MVEDSKLLQKTLTCPRCDTYCLHDVLHTSWCDLCAEAGHKCGQQPAPIVHVMQCRNGACQYQWREGRENHRPCTCKGRGTVMIPCPDGHHGCGVVHLETCRGTNCMAKATS